MLNLLPTDGYLWSRAAAAACMHAGRSEYSWKGAAVRDNHRVRHRSRTVCFPPPSPEFAKKGQNSQQVLPSNCISIWGTPELQHRPEQDREEQQQGEDPYQVFWNNCFFSYEKDEWFFVSPLLRFSSLSLFHAAFDFRRRKKEAKKMFVGEKRRIAYKRLRMTVNRTLSSLVSLSFS